MNAEPGSWLLPIHIVGGSVALIAGFIALFTMKGARVHRKSGMWFVYAMVLMGVTGAVVAGLRAGEGSVIAGLLATYLAVTALTAVRPSGSRAFDATFMVGAIVLGIVSIALGIGLPKAARDGIPVVIFFKFGIVALIGGLSDIRFVMKGALQGTARIARHLWRMCFALYIASASFFLGQADELPKALRITPVLAFLAFLPLLAMVYWLIRVRRKPLRNASAAISTATIAA